MFPFQSLQARSIIERNICTEGSMDRPPKPWSPGFDSAASLQSRLANTPHNLYSWSVVS